MFSSFKYNLNIRNQNASVDTSLNNLWKGIKHQIGDLPSDKSIFETQDKKETMSLIQLDSKYWLFLNIINILQKDSLESESILWKLEELENQRDIISLRLNPLKKKYFNLLYLVQLPGEKLRQLKINSQLTQSYRNELKLLRNIFIKYVANSEPSLTKAQELLSTLEEKRIRHKNLYNLHITYLIVAWMISILNKFSYEETEGYKFPIRSINDNPKYHIPNGCHRYPRIEKPEDKYRGIHFFKTIEDAEASGLDICEDCKRIDEKRKQNII